MHVLKFTDDQMQVLTDALVELPFKKVAPLIQSINVQLTEAREEALKQDDEKPAVKKKRA